MHIYRNKFWGTSGAQLVGHPTLGFGLGLGLDPWVLGLSTVLSVGSAWNSLPIPLCSYPHPSLSL